MLAPDRSWNVPAGAQLTRPFLGLLASSNFRSRPFERRQRSGPAQCAVYRNNRPVLLAACASAIESPFTVFADPGKYEWYSRDQLVPQRKLWESKEKQLKLLMDKAKQSTGGSAISVVAYQGDYVNAREELQVIDATARAKKCKMPDDWQSNAVMR